MVSFSPCCPVFPLSTVCSLFPFIWVKPFPAFLTALRHTLSAALRLQSSRRPPLSHPLDHFPLAPIFPICSHEHLRALHQPILSPFEHHRQLVERIHDDYSKGDMSKIAIKLSHPKNCLVNIPSFFSRRASYLLRQSPHFERLASRFQ